MIYQPLKANGADYSAGIIDDFSSYPLHRHVAIELMYVITGELCVLLDGQSHTVRSGELIFVGSRHSHFVSACQEGTVFLLIEFGPIFTHNHFDGIAALTPREPVLCRGLHPEMDAILPLLEEIVFDPREIERPLYHTLKPDYLYHTVGDRNFVFFALFTHAAAALVKLTGRLGLDSASLHARLSALAESGHAVRDITAEAPDAPSHIEAADFLSHMVRLSRP